MARTISISSRSSHCPRQPITRSRSGKRPSNRRRLGKAAPTGPATRSSSTASPGPPLRKRQAMLTMIRTLHEKGIGLDAISRHLPPSRLRVIPAHLEDPTAIEEALRAQGVNEPERYFLD